MAFAFFQDAKLTKLPRWARIPAILASAMVGKMRTTWRMAKRNVIPSKGHYKHTKMECEEYSCSFDWTGGKGLWSIGETEKQKKKKKRMGKDNDAMTNLWTFMVYLLTLFFHFSRPISFDRQEGGG